MTETYRRVWPVVDQFTPLAALFTEAKADLDVVLAAAGLAPAGRGRWEVVEAASVAEPVAARWVVVAVLPVRPAPVTVSRGYRRRSATVATSGAHAERRPPTQRSPR